jgi:hypothetical protein
MEQPEESITPTNPRKKNEKKNRPAIRGLGILGIITLSVLILNIIGSSIKT